MLNGGLDEGMLAKGENPSPQALCRQIPPQRDTTIVP